jgi:hypothetical protein
MAPLSPELLAEINEFKKRFSLPLADLDPYFDYTNQYPLMTAYLREHGTFPPTTLSDSEESDPEEPEDEGGYISHPEFEDDESDEDEEDLYEEEDGPPPGFDFNDWLDDYEAIEMEAEQEQNPEPQESEPESEVEDPIPYPLGISLPHFSSWHSHMTSLQPGTYCYIEVFPIYPCPLKPQTQQYFMGPIRIVQPCVDHHYILDVPQGYANVYSNKVLFTRVFRTRPANEHRIISNHLDFGDIENYTEVPVHKDLYLDPTGRHYQNPRLRITWRCFGLTEVTVERESTMRAHYPGMFL